MKNMFIQKGLSGIKAVYIDGEKIDDIFVETKEESIVDNIYKGRVEKIAKGMSAAFVDIGTGKNGYLKLNQYDDIKSGDYIYVQVVSDEYSQKGVKLSTKLAIAGKYLVMQNKDAIGISNRIKDQAKRKYLLDAIKEIRTSDRGIIIRTQAKDASLEELKEDINYLEREFDILEREKNLGLKARLIHSPLKGIKRFLRDKLEVDLEFIWIDEKELYDEVVEFFMKYNRAYLKKIKLFEGNTSLFEHFNIDSKLESIFKSKIWLKNGGYLIIDKTEAMTVIDVNTGKNIGKTNFEDTAMDTNAQAAKEIVNLVSLRNIAGIIIVDFIELKEEKNKQKIIEILKMGFSKVKGKTEVFEFTKLGLVEIARKRNSKEYVDFFNEECMYCKGKGSVKKIEELVDELDKKIMRIIKNTNCEIIVIEASNRLYNWIKNNSNPEYFYGRFKIEVEIREMKNFNEKEIQVIYMGSKNMCKK